MEFLLFLNNNFNLESFTILHLTFFSWCLLSLVFFLFTHEKNVYKLRKYAVLHGVSLYVIILYFLFLYCEVEINSIPLTALTTLNAQFETFFLYIFNPVSNFYFSNFPQLNYSFLSIKVDTISYIFLILVSFIFPICFIFSSTKIQKYKKFLTYLLLLEYILILCFLTNDLFMFYVLFEGSLILMFFIIGLWGSRSRKIKAAYYFFFYTLFGSIFMYIALFLIYMEAGTFRIQLLQTFEFSSFYIELVIWLCLFIPFAIKIPMFPFHLWLLEAHVEAPTIGSVILASLLLKLGTYAIFRFLMPMLHSANLYFRPLIFLLSLLSILFASFSALRQVDIKRIIAYSSIAHMNLTLFGMYSFTLSGIQGSMLLMIGHGFISAALFFLIGVVYDRVHTRLLQYLTGLVTVMPLFSVFFFLFTFANISFPGTINFIAEILIFYGVVLQYKVLAFILIFSTFFVVLFLILSFNRMTFGNLSRELDILFFTDITKREFFCLFSLFFFTLLFGFFSVPFLQFIELPIRILLKLYY